MVNARIKAAHEPEDLTLAAGAAHGHERALTRLFVRYDLMIHADDLMKLHAIPLSSRLRLRAFCVALLLCANVLLGAETPKLLRVAVAVEAGDAMAGLAAQEVVAAALARRGECEVLERGAVDLLLREGSLNALVRDDAQRVRLGRLLGLDRFVHLRQSGGAWRIEIVDAQSGRLLAQGEAATPTELPARAAELLSNADGAARHTTRVAVLAFAGGSGAEAPVRAALDSAESALREALRAAGLDVLDRALTPRVAREQADVEQGFISNDATTRPLLGAQVLVRGALVAEERGPAVELTLLDAANGRVSAARRFPLPKGSLPAELTAWLFAQLQVPAPSEAVLPQGVELEALEAFYGGIALFEGGQFLEATEKFQDAYSHNDKFAEAMLWEARCYDAAGLRELGDAMRHFQRTSLVGVGWSREARFAPQEALTFLGVAGPPTGGAQALAARLGMVAIDRLLARRDVRLLLDGELARFRDEYDQLVGTRNAEGTRWETAPGFAADRALHATLSGPASDGTWSVTWSLITPLDGRTLARETMKLRAAPGEWPAIIGAGLQRLLAAKAPPAAEPAAAAALPPVAELEARLKRAGAGREANIPLLQLALADPANALLAGRELRKPGNSKTGLAAFLNHALRDHLVAVLPPENATRAWLELMQIQRFTDHEPFGRAVSPRQIEPRRAFAEFAAAHADDLPGALAQFFLLRDTCDELPPAQLVVQLQQLQQRLARGQGQGGLADFRKVESMTQHLLTLARIASGLETNPRLPVDGFPYFVVLDFGSDGKPRLERDSYWSTPEWGTFEFTPEEAVNEARAGLALAGRPNEHFKVEDRWMRELPHSVLLTSYCASAIHEAGEPFGEPFLHPFDAAAEKAAHRAIVQYAVEGLRYWMRRATRPAQMDLLEESARRIVMFTCETKFAETIPDAEQLTIRALIIQEMAAADGRLGRTRWGVLNPIFTGWRGFDRAFARERGAFRLGNNSIVYFDREMVLGEVRAAGAQAFTGSEGAFRKWWSLVRGNRLNDTIGPQEVAALVVPHAEEMHRCYAGPDFSERELGHWLDFGIVLMDGGEFAEAERAFRKVVEAPAGDLTRSGDAGAVRASAAYYLALLFRQANRVSEAAQAARSSLEFAREKAFPLIERYDSESAYSGRIYYMENNTSVRAHALRLLSDLRFDPTQARLPERVGVIEVPTPNLDNPKLRVYYRLPPGAAEAKEPLPVLVLATAHNHLPLDDLRPSSAWARFADDAGLVLVAPEFFAHKWATVTSAAITGYGFVQVWSGDALLKAIAQLGGQVPLRADALLFHGYGEGASFCARFARWKPERCRAVSGHSSSSLPWYEEINGLQSLSKVRGVSFLVTCGEEDGRGVEMWNRLQTTEQFATMARGAGVPVLWRSWPGVFHVPTREMEELSRAFLRAQARPEAARETFIGDRRTWKYFSPGSTAANAIPMLFREELPSRDVARLWGKEGG
ncbi:MAG: hypothetical protein QOE70_113 [Chthoniobacter sp.]|jgi:tetratricopeptide (TPR) repeat protein|nr:hypothetical protein [Chthoniobacter sp.]